MDDNELDCYRLIVRALLVRHGGQLNFTLKEMAEALPIQNCPLEWEPIEGGGVRIRIKRQ